MPVRGIVSKFIIAKTTSVVANIIIDYLKISDQGEIRIVVVSRVVKNNQSQ